MAEITAAEVAKLRKLTGAGMMDCKKALVEADGDMDRAIELIRERGKAIANKRADREAGEGAALAKVNEAGNRGAIVVLNCETDFVAKNADFVGVASKILDHALSTSPANLEALKESTLDGKKVADVVAEFSGITGEKMELSYYEFVEAPMVVSYIHPGNKLATIVGFSKAIDVQAAKDVAMQVAAMNPVAIDKDDVPEDIRQKEFEIGREQARQEGKPENLLDKIAEGKLNKFYKESTLLNQEFIKDNKMTIRQYLQGVDKDVKVTAFKRFSLNS
ncbi:translation elongation factor Ts [Tenuifilum thalassicum]|uniref:Elongation factor Ts n=1 Tax=Tenuifilum thalassicum TaxID=2590900 RepID=A0A7D3XEW1_9BACT|nr:translation elongation factor Ts [Tenuifilum thalassicum]QKG79057.1 elongation factor Ts [Tenuifilum thalassicum]